MSKLAGKRVLITGGAQGIGLQMAMKFAGRGSEIVIADTAPWGSFGGWVELDSLVTVEGREEPLRHESPCP